MDTAGIEVLKAWEDRPRRELSVDLKSVRLDNRRAFLLTRLDGSSSISELCSISGMTEKETLEALADLVRQGLAVVETASGRRTPIAPTVLAPMAAAPVPPPPALAPDEIADPSSGIRSAEPVVEDEPTPVLEQIDELPDFNGVAPQDVSWLKGKAEMGRVPGMPWRRPGEDRYGRYVFDRRALLRHCDLTVAQRRDVLFLFHAGSDLDHFEFFDMEPTADRAEWRRAFFRFSKLFHPDAFFRKDLGDFKQMLDAVHRRGARIHDAFSADAELRERYHRAVLARTEAYRKALEDARERFNAACRAVEDRKQARQDAAQQRASARRMVALRDRLAVNQQARRDNHNPALERIERARRYYEQGMQHYRDEKFLEAASVLQLAMTFDPNNETYSQAHARVSERAKAIRAEHAWKLGTMQETVGRMDEALVSYLDAVTLVPRPDRCLHTAEIMLSLDKDLHRAAELARVASDADPQNVEYLLLLGRIYERVNLAVKAAAVLERALKLAPKDERIKKAMKALKR